MSISMPAWITIMTPALKGLRNTLKQPGKGGYAKVFLVGAFTMVIWVLVFAFAVKVLQNLRAADVIGDLLCRKFLGLLWISGAALLMFSAIISSLSNFFLSRDLDLLMGAPVSLESIFWARSTQSLITSSWMPIAFLLPIFLAYAFVYKPHWEFYLVAPLATVPILAGAGYISQILVMVLVNVFPARRAKEIMGLLAILAFCGLYMAFRLMRPEQLVNPQGFMSAAAYLASLQSPASIILPTEWATEAVWNQLTGQAGRMGSGLWLLMLWSTLAALATATSWAAEYLYWQGYNKSMTGSSRRRGGLIAAVIGAPFRLIGNLMKPERKALMVKDLKTFFRDHAQWSQLILLAALMVIYIYNFSVLNLGRYPAGAFILEHSFAFLNLGLVALVGSTLALRFAFPSVSGEGFAYWIIKAAPMSLKEFMWIKYWLWMPPIWIVSLALVIFGNYYLNVKPVMNVASVLITAALIPSLCALAIGLGAKYPRFEAANSVQAPTGYGGLVYMVTSSIASLAVIGLSVWPIMRFIRDRWSNAQIVLCTVLILMAVSVCLYLMIFPMRQGLYALQYGGSEDGE